MDLTTGIIRILGSNDETVGTGFLVSDEGLAATCAHVVRDAGAGPGDTIRLVLHHTNEERKAFVEPSWWRDPDAEDVAFLRLQGVLPTNTDWLLLGSSMRTETHPFKSFGFPSAMPVDGLWGYGTLGDPTTDEGYPVRQLTSKEVTRGFSGAPVLDKITRRVVGMVTVITLLDRSQRLKETSLFVPSETLLDICSDLALSDICPYRGLAAFTEDDAEFFFGREMVVADLVARLKGSPRFLAIVGGSGSGKSSVVQAGLFPALRQGQVPGSDRWHLLSFRPGKDPFAALRASGLDSEPEEDLASAVRRFVEKHEQVERLVLFVDQGEELFVLCPERLRDRFLSQLQHLLDNSAPVTIILALRSDFYGELLDHDSLREWLDLNQANVRPILKEELRTAVEEPAEMLGLRFELGLVETIVEQTDQITHPLPLVEALLTQMWERRKDGMLTWEAYEMMGCVPGAISLWAEDTFGGLDKENKLLARRVFVRLVHYGEGRVRDTRRQRTLEELLTHPEERGQVHQLVQRLADARLLVTDQDLSTGEETIELVHDALLDRWNRLQRWRAERRDFYLWRQRLAERLQEWEEKHQNVGALLRGALLTEAKRWLKECPDELNPAERTYIQESIAVGRRRLMQVVGAVLLVVLLLNLGLGLSCYISTSDTWNVVVRTGHPGFKLLPWFDQVAVTTGYSIQDLDDPSLASEERLWSSWLQRREGQAHWGDQLYSHLEDAKAGLAYWRAGNADQSLIRLAQGVAAEDTDCVKILGYLAMQSEAGVERVTQILIVALQGNDELHEEAQMALAVVRDTQPTATADQLTSMMNHVGTTDGAEAVALAEAISILSAQDQAASEPITANLLSILKTSHDPDVQMLTVRALNALLQRDPSLFPMALPDLAEMIHTSRGDVQQGLIALLRLPTSLDSQAQALALQTIVEVMDAQEPEIRREATITLGHLMSTAPISVTTDHLPTLLAMADDTDGGVRSAVAEALAILPPDFLVRMDVRQTAMDLTLEDTDYNVRYKAARVLANMHNEDPASEIVNCLVAATGDINENVRWEAVHALIKVGTEQTAEISQIENALWAMVDDGSPDVRQEAAQGLLLLADRVEGDLTPALEEFLLALGSDDWRQVENAERLSQRFAVASGEAASIVAGGLVPYALRSAPLTSNRIVDLLASIGWNQPQGLTGVILALTDLLAADETAGQANNRIWTLRTQPSTRLEPSLVALFERLNSVSPVERRTAARAVGWLAIGDEDLALKAMPHLVSAFADPETMVRVEIARSLGRLARNQPPAAQPALNALLECVATEAEVMRIACLDGLESIAQGESPSASIMLSTLLAALQDPSPDVRRHAAKVLAHLRTGAPEQVRDAIEPLRSALSVELDTKTRLSLASALGTLGGQNPEIADQVITVAKAGLNNNETDLREQAIWVLATLGKYHPTAAGKALEALTPTITDSDPNLRRLTILAMREIGVSDTASAIPALAALKPALAHPDTLTRWDAIINGIDPIIHSQPSSSADAVLLLRDFGREESNFQDDNGWLHRDAWDTLVFAYRTLVTDDLGLLWPLITSGAVGERAIGQETLTLVVAKHPNLLDSAQDRLATLRRDWRPHVRQSAARAEEMIAIVQHTSGILDDRSTAERWYEILDWLPSVDVGAAREFARDEIRRVYPEDSSSSGQ